jgi:hypothetical protein
MADIETAQKPFVFVLMPFARECKDVYELHIKDAATATGTCLLANLGYLVF